jgi:peroxiredoxin
MAQTASTMRPLGTPAPDFTLPDVRTGHLVSLSDFRDKQALLVIFLCRHCPFVKHIQHELAHLGNEYLGRGVGVVAISANDADKYPEDAPDKLREMAGELGFQFPLLYDADQQTAKAYTAACTPDFFVFDQERRLVYRGQFDGSRPSNDIPVTGNDLRKALNSVLASEPIEDEQKPSIGCNIKWKPGNQPAYA